MTRRLEIDVIDAGVKLRLRGRLDASSTPSARARLHQQLDDGGGELVLDLRGLEIWDGPGLGVLVGVSRRAQRAGRSLVLTGVGARELRLLRVARLTWTSDVHPAEPGTTPATRIERPLRTGGVLARI